MRRRAEQVDATRLRIVEATVELHASVGPARTTISAIAERAGVQRLTVYHHFKDETDLYQACKAHWFAGRPLPDLAVWAAISDPLERLPAALMRTYAYFDAGEGMIANVLRDAEVLPYIAQEVGGSFGLYMGRLVEVLAVGWPDPGGLLRPALGHAIAFSSWQQLARQGQLTATQICDLMVGTVLAASSVIAAPASFRSAPASPRAGGRSTTAQSGRRPAPAASSLEPG